MGCQSSKQKQKTHHQKSTHSGSNSEHSKVVNYSVLTNPSEGSNQQKKLLNQTIQKQNETLRKLEQENSKLKTRLSQNQLVFNNSEKLFLMAPNKRICAQCLAKNDINKMSTIQRQKLYDVCQVCNGQGLLKNHKFLTVDRCGICRLYFQYLWIIQQCSQCNGAGSKTKMLQIQSDSYKKHQ